MCFYKISPKQKSGILAFKTKRKTMSPFSHNFFRKINGYLYEIYSVKADDCFNDVFFLQNGKK